MKTEAHHFSSLIIALAGTELKSQLLAHDKLCEFFFADTADKALVMLGTHLFDLIFIDSQFPTADLLAFIKIVSRDTPLIAVTEANDLSDHKRLIETGFDDYLMKPLNAENILETAAFWLADNELENLTACVSELLLKFNNDHNFVSKLWQNLFTELPEQMHSLEMVLGRREYEQVFFIAHKINGAAKMCLLQEIGASAAKLEELIRQQHYDNLESAWQTLQQKITQLLARQEYIFNQLARSSSRA